jgi:uncharacterized MnhB-related membrane protein
MNALSLLFDGLMALTLIVLAARLLFSRELFTSIVLFVAFGLLMALVWVRLDAGYVAMVEAAIGTGLTGALLLGAAAQLHADRDKDAR